MENNFRAERILAAIYFIWFFLQLALFFYSDEGPDSSLFWPFNSGDKTLAATYDIVEFLVYVGGPVILYIAYKIVSPTPFESSGRRHSNNNFFVAFLDEKIRAEQLSQRLNEITNQPVNHAYLNELMQDRDKAATQGVAGWLDRMEVKKKYKDFEKVS